MAIEYNRSGRRWAKIDMRLLTIKLHYLFLFGGISAIGPYLSLYARQLGLNSTIANVIFAVLPITFIFSQTVIGAIADRFRRIKIMIMIFVMTVAILWGMLLLIPPLVQEKITGMIPMKCDKNTSRTVPSIIHSQQCFEHLMNLDTICTFRVEQCNDLRGKRTDYCVDTCNNATVHDVTASNNSSSEIFSHSFIKIPINNSLPCDCYGLVLHLISCESSSDSCLHGIKIRSENIYETIQFWSFVTLIATSYTALVSAISLTDVLCYKMLGKESQMYGRQRLWGTISTGFSLLVSNYLFHSSDGLDSVNYAPGFYIMFYWLALDIIILFRMDTKSAYVSEPVFDGAGFFVSFKNVVFVFGVFLVGILNSFLAYFEYLHLQDLGVSQVLQNLILVVQFFLAETFCFFVSGKFVTRLGHYYCLILSFVAFTVRGALYYSLINPWFALPIELLHGFTFAVFYAAMTSYAYAGSSSGTEATTFGVLGGMYNGLGTAVGSQLSGVAYSYLKRSDVFLTAAITSGIFVMLFSSINLAFETFHERAKMRQSDEGHMRLKP